MIGEKVMIGEKAVIGDKDDEDLDRRKRWQRDVVYLG